MKVYDPTVGTSPLEILTVTDVDLVPKRSTDHAASSSCEVEESGVALDGLQADGGWGRRTGRRVSEFVSLVGIGQSSGSHHLAKLKALELIGEECQAGSYSLKLDRCDVRWSLVTLARDAEDSHGDGSRLAELMARGYDRRPGRGPSLARSARQRGRSRRIPHRVEPGGRTVTKLGPRAVASAIWGSPSVPWWTPHLHAIMPEAVLENVRQTQRPTHWWRIPSCCLRCLRLPRSWRPAAPSHLALFPAATEPASVVTDLSLHE